MAETCPPPKELDSKHFNDRMAIYRLAVKNTVEENEKALLRR